jgi:hypothetical protein
MYVAIYMTVIIALCLIVYFTLPETGSRKRATVALTDPEVLEGRDCKKIGVTPDQGEST